LDLSGSNQEHQVHALSTIPRLSDRESVSEETLLLLLDQVSILSSSENPDVSFLARKAENFLRSLGKESAGEGSGSAPHRAGQTAVQSTAHQLVVAIQSEGDPTKIATLLTGLKKLGDASVLPDLLRFLEHEDARVRANTVECVEELGSVAHASALLPLLKDPNNRVRGNVVKTLGGWKINEVVECLRGMLSDDQVSHRESGLYAIAHLPNLPGLELVSTLVDDPYEGVRLRLVHYLDGLEGEGSVALLRKLVVDVHPQVREQATTALIRRGEDPVSPVPVGEKAPDLPLELESLNTDKLNEALQKSVLQIAHALGEEESRIRLARALFLAGARGFDRVLGGELTDRESVASFYEVMKVQQLLKTSLCQLPTDPQERKVRFQQIMGLYHEHLRASLVRHGRVLYVQSRAGAIPSFPELDDVARVESSAKSQAST